MVENKFNLWTLDNFEPPGKEVTRELRPGQTEPGESYE